MSKSSRDDEQTTSNANILPNEGSVNGTDGIDSKFCNIWDLEPVDETLEMGMIERASRKAATIEFEKKQNKPLHETILTSDQTSSIFFFFLFL